MTRECGSCTLCCKLVPVPELAKVQNERCRYQRHGKGCTIYARRPMSCRAWHCGWLQGPHNDMLRRPDHVHYVIDCMLDTVASEQPDGSYEETEVVQIWADPDYLDDVIKEPGLRAWLEKINGVAIVRSARDAPGLLMVPPERCAERVWMTRGAGLVTQERKQELIGGGACQ